MTRLISLGKSTIVSASLAQPGSKYSCHYLLNCAWAAAASRRHTIGSCPYPITCRSQPQPPKPGIVGTPSMLQMSRLEFRCARAAEKLVAIPAIRAAAYEACEFVLGGGTHIRGMNEARCLPRYCLGTDGSNGGSGILRHTRSVIVSDKKRPPVSRFLRA